MLISPVAISLFAFIALVAGTAIFFALEKRVATMKRPSDPAQ